MYELPRKRVGRTARAEEKQPPVEPQKSPSGLQQPVVDPKRAHGDKVGSAAEVVAGQQALDPFVDDLDVVEPEVPNGLLEERALSSPGLDHDEPERRNCELERNRRGAAAGSEVHAEPIRRQDSPRGRQRFHEQAIDHLVAHALYIKRCEVDRPIPSGEKFDVLRQRGGKRRGNNHSGMFGPLGDSRGKTLNHAAILAWPAETQRADLPAPPAPPAPDPVEGSLAEGSEVEGGRSAA